MQLRPRTLGLGLMIQFLTSRGRVGAGGALVEGSATAHVLLQDENLDLEIDQVIRRGNPPSSEARTKCLKHTLCCFISSSIDSHLFIWMYINYMKHNIHDHHVFHAIKKLPSHRYFKFFLSFMLCHLGFLLTSPKS